MKKRIINTLKILLYLTITGLLIYTIFLVSLIIPWDVDYMSRRSEFVTTTERINVTILFWQIMAIANGIVAFVVRRFNMAFFVLSIALTVMCVLNCMGTFMLY